MSQTQIQKLFPLPPISQGALQRCTSGHRSDGYIQQRVMSVEGPWDIGLVERSIRLLAERFDVFRASFVYLSEQWQLQLLAEPAVPWHSEDIRDLPEEAKQARLEAFLAEERGQAVVPEAGGLIRLAAFAWGDKHWKLIWSFPDWLLDPGSLENAAAAWLEIYSSLRASHPAALSPLCSYSGYLDWLAAQNQDEAIAYWRECISDTELETALPGRVVSGATAADVPPAYESVMINAAETRRLTALAEAAEVTLQTVLHTVWSVLLQAYNRSADVVFGAVAAGRPAAIPGIRHAAGWFEHVVPLRIAADERDTFVTLARRMHSACTEANRYAYVPLAAIQAETMLRQKLISHTVAVREASAWFEPAAELFPGGAALLGIASEQGAAEPTYGEFAVLMSVGETLEIRFTYLLSRYEADMVRRMSLHLKALIGRIAQEPHQPVAGLDILTEGERNELTVGFNATAAEFPQDTTIVALFERQAALVADQAAVMYGDETLTYRELNARVNQAARSLQHWGVQPDDIVGVMVERSAEMAIALLAVLKAGGAYLPIDPALPKERIRYLLEDSGANIVLTQGRFEAKLRAAAQPAGQTEASNAFDPMQMDEQDEGGQNAGLTGGAQQFQSKTAQADAMQKAGLADDEQMTGLISTAHNDELTRNVRLVLMDDPALYRGDTSNPPLAAGPGHLVYVIYTSGTTGNPKGVMIEHRSLVNRLYWMQKHYPIGTTDVIMQKTPYAFDASVWEQFGWAIHGAKVVFLEPGAEKDPERIVDAMARYGVTAMHFVPSMLAVFLSYIEARDRALPDIRLSGLRYVFASGEALSVKTAEQFNALFYRGGQTKLVNLYGPTEATIEVTYFDCSTGEPLPRMLVGRPMDNTQVYVIGRGGALQPVGVPGELCIAGVQLARGYLNRPGLTAEKFTPIPFRMEERMYRTGDLGRWLPDGRLEYLGRMDHQVKIRGYRIELGEIEHQLLRHPAVRETLVIAAEDEAGDAYLCAYVVAAAGLTQRALNNHLAFVLPQYMIPARFVLLDRMPLTANGKVDRRALPLPSAQAIHRGYEPPRNETESRLAAIWQEVLGVERVGIRDNFFELGGQSLKGIQVVAKALARGIPLGLNQLLQAQTIFRLANGLSEASPATAPSDGQDHHPAASLAQAEERLTAYLGTRCAIVAEPPSGPMPIGRLVLEVDGTARPAQRQSELEAFISAQLDPSVQPHAIRWAHEPAARLRQAGGRREPRTGQAQAEPPNEAGARAVRKAFTGEADGEAELRKLTEHFAADALAQIEAMHRGILREPVIRTEPLSGMQLFHMMQPDNSGAVVELDAYLRLDVMVEAVTLLLSRHSLLRSTLGITPAGPWWEVREASSRLPLPVLDLSALPHDDAQRVALQLIAKLMYAPFDLQSGLPLHRMTLVKLNLRDHVLILSFSHMIFDYMSGEVIRQELLQCYRLLERGMTLPEAELRDFSDYTEQLGRGPQGLNESQLVAAFQLDAYAAQADRIAARLALSALNKRKAFAWTLPVGRPGEPPTAEEVWQTAFSQIVQLCRSYFGVEQVPIWVTHFGRHYEQRVYYDLIGECIDQIPILADAAEAPEALASDVKARIDLAARHNVNFTTLLFNAEIAGRCPEAHQLLAACFRGVPIVFNYVGQNVSGILEYVKPPEAPEFAGSVFLFTASAAGNLLHLSLVMPYAHEDDSMERLIGLAVGGEV